MGGVEGMDGHLIVMKDGEVYLWNNGSDDYGVEVFIERAGNNVVAVFEAKSIKCVTDRFLEVLKDD